MLPNGRPRLAESVVHAGPAGVQLPDHGENVGRFGGEPSGCPWEEGDQRGREVEVGHQSITTASTLEMGGRKSAACSQFSPSSGETKTWPVLVPK